MKSAVLFFPIMFIACCEGKRDRNRHAGSRMMRDKDDNAQGQCELEITCKGDTSGRGSVKLPIKGPRGPPGRAGEKGAPGTPGTPGKPGLPGKSSSPGVQVAFFVGLGANKGPQEGNRNLSFDKVLTNIGGAYNESTGLFIAPKSGVYNFNVVVAAQGYKKAAVMVMMNGRMVQTVWAESIPSWATASSTAILNLKTGDQIWLVLLKRAPFLHGYMYTSYSGHLLFTTEEDSEQTTTTEMPEMEPEAEVTEAVDAVNESENKSQEELTNDLNALGNDERNRNRKK